MESRRFIYKCKAVKWALLFSLIPFAGSSQNAFTLKEAVEYALANNPAHLNAQLEQEINLAKKNEVRGMGLPQVSASFDVKDFIEIPTSLIPGEFFGAPAGTYIPVKFGTKYNATAGFSVSQILFSNDYLVALKASHAFLELSEKSVQRSSIETIANVNKAYYTVLVNRERLKLVQSNVERIEKLLKDTRALNQNGFVEKIDVDRVEVAYNNLVSEKEKITKLMGLTETLLKFQMGIDVSQSITLKDSLDVGGIPPAAIAEMSSPDVKKRIEYSLLQSQRRLNLLDVQRNKMGFLPTVVAYGSVNAQAQRGEFNIFNTEYRWFPVAVIGATVNLPIFNGGQKHYKLQQAKLSLRVTDNTIKNLENLVKLEISSATVAFQNAWTSVNTQRKNMELAKNIFDVSRKKYEQGIGSSLEVITAETALKEAQANFYDAVYAYYVAKIDYEKATGTLTK